MGKRETAPSQPVSHSEATAWSVADEVISWATEASFNGQPDRFSAFEAVWEYRRDLLAPIIAVCRLELETGSAVGSGLALAERILKLCGEEVRNHG